LQATAQGYSFSGNILSLTLAAAIIENHLGMRFVNFIAMPQMPQFIVGPQPMRVG
jgi:hypothetical protein